MHSALVIWVSTCDVLGIKKDRHTQEQVVREIPGSSRACHSGGGTLTQEMVLYLVLCKD